jgi:hypothetical protein
MSFRVILSPMDFEAWIREQLGRPDGSASPRPIKQGSRRQPALPGKVVQAILVAGAFAVIAIGLAAPGQLPNLTLPLASAQQPGLPVSTLAGGPRSGNDDTAPGHASANDPATPSPHGSQGSTGSSDASHGRSGDASVTSAPAPAPIPTPSDDGGHGGRPRD